MHLNIFIDAYVYTNAYTCNACEYICILFGSLRFQVHNKYIHVHTCKYIYIYKSTYTYEWIFAYSLIVEGLGCII